jgi:hypothetical protein
MKDDQDKFLQTAIQILHDWTASLGGIAAVLFGFLLLAGLVILCLSFRWIRRGGLKRQTTSGFFRRQQTAEQFLRRKN